MHCSENLDFSHAMITMTMIEYRLDCMELCRWKGNAMIAIKYNLYLVQCSGDSSVASCCLTRVVDMQAGHANTTNSYTTATWLFFLPHGQCPWR